MTLFAWLVAGVVALANIWWLLAGLLVLMFVHVWRSLVVSAGVQRGLARAELGLVALRADREQALVLAGDVRGVYGDYPPAEMRKAAPVVSGQR